VVASVIAGVEKSVESDLSGRAGGGHGVQVRMLGPMTISRDGQPLALPSSRKVRALIGYLALAPHAVTRSKLCELLWDVPNDPRGELRWCLSKVRGILDEPGRRRVQTRDDTIALSRSPARPSRASRRSHRSGCVRCACCSPATFSMAWRSTAARSSRAG
jgi:hypothetical protein